MHSFIFRRAFRLDQAAYLDLLEHESSVVPLGDAFHMAKNAKNCASNCILRTPMGSWSLAQVMVVLRAIPALQRYLHIEDCCLVDRQNCASTERARDLAHSHEFQALCDALIVSTLEVRKKAEKGTRFDAVYVVHNISVLY